MQYPIGSGRGNSEIISSELRGINRQARGADGAFSDCRNIQTDKYPCISTCAAYENIETGYTNIQFAICPMYGAAGFCGVADGVFYWDGEAKEYAELSHYTMEKTSKFDGYVINGYVFIREEKPDGRFALYRYDIYDRDFKNGFDAQDTPADGRIYCVGQIYANSFDSSGNKTHCKMVQISNTNGVYSYGFIATAPAVPSTTDKTVKGTVYPILAGGKDNSIINIEENPNLEKAPKDAVISNPSKIEGTNNVGEVIVSYNLEARFDGDLVGCPNNHIEYQTVNKVTFDYSPVSLFLHIPPKTVSYAVYKNRVWTGRSDGGAVFATSWGSGENFWKFEGISTDSVEVEISTQGRFTGFFEYNGSLLCFKRDSITVIYGDTADNFAIGKDIKGVGCVDIRSCEIIDGVLYFLGSDGFYSYSGGWPQLISSDLNTRYEKCISFAFEGKYYAEGTKSDGTKEIAVYDTRRGIWLLEDVQGIRGVYYKDSDVYIVTENAVKKRRPSYEYEKADEEWFFESMDLYENIIEKKGINEIYVRAKLKEGTRMTVFTRGEDGELTEHKTFTGSGRLETYRVPVRFSKKEAYRYRICGKGPAIIYEVLRKVSAGGRKIYEE